MLPAVLVCLMPIALLLGVCPTPSARPAAARAAFGAFRPNAADLVRGFFQDGRIESERIAPFVMAFGEATRAAPAS